MQDGLYMSVQSHVMGCVCIGTVDGFMLGPIVESEATLGGLMVRAVLGVG